MKNLVIVESPAKAKTIEKFLGKDYKVMSSQGHIRDLSKHDSNVVFDNNYAPDYVVPAEKKELVKQLKAEAKKADIIWLASDEDREGEAIAWHLAQELNLNPEQTRRIVFHEITKPAILHAIENPRDIDIDRVNAQQARRVLDRIVGFKLSPVLWARIKPSLSAGRVQSVAVRLICEREKEINDFVPEQFWKIAASLKQDSSDQAIKAELPRRITDRDAANKIVTDCAKGIFTVADVAVRPIKRAPQPPFTTSTLQQEAARKLGMSVNRTMQVAQKLYEEGHITYMRTDSLNLSELAMADIAKTIKSDFGDKFLHSRRYHTKSKGAQEAHEAIRPTYINKSSISGSEQEQRLYDLIRRRTLASQMADAELEKTTVEFHSDAAPENFTATGEVLTFPGFMALYSADKVAEADMLPPLAKGQILKPIQVSAAQRFTQAPPRYTEASLVKKMEELGIGRPSTYASTITTIQSRDYVKRGEREGAPRSYITITAAPGKETVTQELSENSGSDKGKLVPTDIGMIVNDFLTQFFPDILDYNFTARVEEKFDEISEGKLCWQQELHDFYADFNPSIEKVKASRSEHKVGERLLGEDPASGRPIYVKIGRFGPVVQKGNANDEQKPLFASLKKDQSIQTITLEEALKLFELPRHLGQFEDAEVVAAIGRFGPYIRHGKAFVSIPKSESPETITLEQAIDLIQAKREEEANRIIKTFPEMPGLEVLNGRFGPYVAYKPEGAKKATNYRLPKGSDPKALTLDDVKALMKAQDEAPAKPKARRSAAKKSK